MNKVISWVAGFTSVGKYVKKAQLALDGKKATLASLGTAVAGTLTILAKFAAEDGGLDYLLRMATTEEFLAASGGWVAFFLSLKGEKIRKENAEILDAVATTEEAKPAKP